MNGETSASWATPSSQPEPEPSARPYAGRLYVNYPTWVSLEEWLAGGGTSADYDWRPEYVTQYKY